MFITVNFPSVGAILSRSSAWRVIQPAGILDRLQMAHTHPPRTHQAADRVKPKLH